MISRARDPELTRRATLLLAALVVLWPLLTLSQFRPAVLFDPQNLTAMGNFLHGFLSLERSPEFVARLARATVETLAIATAGITCAVVIAAPLALLMTPSLSISLIGPGPGRITRRLFTNSTRALLVLLRGVPELVWALVFVRALGLGATAGVLALAITYGGMLGKVYAEILDSSDARSARALLEAGSGRVPALLYGLWPAAKQEIVSYTAYRWECAVRASVVMGFVGAGGLGQLMDQAMKMMAGSEAASILLVFLLLVLLADGVSAFLRKMLA